MDPIGVDVGREVSERPDRSGWVGTLATTFLTTMFGWFAIWSAPVNGDEGYLLLSLREWTIRGGLFDHVYSQYGPFYYALFGGPSRVLDIRWTIASGRVVSLVLWVTAAFLVGLTVRALSGRWQFGVAAQVTTFSVLATLVNEPMHPGALLCALLAALLANVAWCRPRAPAVSDLVSGALTAALLLTKVNVGLFAVVALAFATQRDSDRAWRRWISSAALIGLGPLLLLANGRDGWRLQWAMVYAVSAAAIVVASSPRRDRRALSFGLGRFGIGFAALAALAVGAVVVTGTSGQGLVEGVVLRPLEHPDIVTVPVRLPGWTWAWLGVALVVGALAWRYRGGSGRTRVASAGGAAGVARVGAGMALLLSVLDTTDPFGAMRHAGSRYALLPLVALVLVPPGRDAEDHARLGRLVLAAAAVTESLHAFPVPGSQVSWSVVIAAAAAVLIVADGCAALGTSLARNRKTMVSFVAAGLCVLVVLVIPFGLREGVHAPGDQFRAWLRAYQAEPRLPVAGGGPLRVPSWQHAVIVHTVPTVRRACSAFVTLGTQLSWYVLVDQRPPTGLNQPAWSAYLDDREQRRNIRAMERTPRPCLLLGTSGGTRDGDRVTAGVHVLRSPLVRWLEHERWHEVSAFGGLAVLRSGRGGAPAPSRAPGEG